MFGRLDLPRRRRRRRPPEREVRYIGRLGVRDDDYEPLVIDWRAPAASPFYRATPSEPMDVRAPPRACAASGSDRRRHRGRPAGRRRARRTRAVVGDGALHGGPDPRPRRPDARHRRDHPAPPGRGDPGERARHHRDHRRARHRQDRRGAAPGRIPALLATGGGTSAAASSSSARRPAYTSYIERVLPSLGEETVDAALPRRRRRRHHAPTGSTPPRGARSRGAADPAGAVAGAPAAGRTGRRSSARSSPGRPCGSTSRARPGAVGSVLRQPPAQPRARHRRRSCSPRPRAPAEAASGDARTFVGAFEDHLEVDAFLAGWWPQLDPREVLLWLRDRNGCAARRGRARRRERRSCSLVRSRGPRDGIWSVADVALVDDVAARLGPVQAPRVRSAASTRSRSSTTSRSGASRAARPASPDRVEPAVRR